MTLPPAAAAAHSIHFNSFRLGPPLPPSPRLPPLAAPSPASRAKTSKMETPLSTRRITRSLTAAAASAHKDSTTHFSRTKNAAGDCVALHDITNDSPIVGLTAGGLHADKTPASTAAKTRPSPHRTPGSGEALLRCQVNKLLQKVHEEACAAAVVRPARIQALLGVSRSPAQLLAPTPANTPQLGPVSASREGFLLTHEAGLVRMPCALEEDELLPKLQVPAASLPPPPEEKLGECQLNRALAFDDSPGKSDLSSGSVASSSLTYQGSSSDDRSPDDDNSSVWSIQAHASSEKGDEELGEDTVGELEEEEYTEPEEGWQGDGDCFDDLCEWMSKMTVIDEEEEPVGLPAFEGRHTRFIYNSDGEMEREEVAVDAAAEHGALVLRGLPVPEWEASPLPRGGRGVIGLRLD